MYIHTCARPAGRRRPAGSARGGSGTGPSRPARYICNNNHNNNNSSNNT